MNIIRLQIEIARITKTETATRTGITGTRTGTGKEETKTETGDTDPRAEIVRSARDQEVETNEIRGGGAVLLRKIVAREGENLLSTGMCRHRALRILLPCK